MVTLTAPEKTKAQSFEARREKLYIERSLLAAQYTADTNRLAEQEQQLSIEASQFCFELKKAHSLPPSTTYELNENAGRLVKK